MKELKREELRLVTGGVSDGEAGVSDGEVKKKSNGSGKYWWDNGWNSCSSLESCAERCSETRVLGFAYDGGGWGVAVRCR